MTAHLAVEAGLVQMFQRQTTGIGHGVEQGLDAQHPAVRALEKAVQFQQQAIERQLVGVAFRQAAHPAVQVQGVAVFGAFQGDCHVIELERANAVLGLKSVYADSGTKFCNDIGSGMHRPLLFVTGIAKGRPRGSPLSTHGGWSRQGGRREWGSVDDGNKKSALHVQGALRDYGGAEGTRTLGLRRDRPAL